MDNKNHKREIKLSPSSLNLFLECPLCFWLEKKKGIRRPPPFPYALNNAVDFLLKKEFDQYRFRGEPHPLMVVNGIKAKLFPNQELLNQWRNNRVGIRYYDSELDATLLGAVDDILEFPDGKLAPLDYKSTGSKVATIYDRFQIQMDVYTYLLEKNGFLTSRKGYLAFYVVNRENGFEDRLPFRKEMHEIDTDPSYVKNLFKDAISLIRRNTSPSHTWSLARRG